VATRQFRIERRFHIGILLKRNLLAEIIAQAQRPALLPKTESAKRGGRIDADFQARIHAYHDHLPQPRLMLVQQPITGRTIASASVFDQFFRVGRLARHRARFSHN
jgi:hypothetical protein